MFSFFLILLCLSVACIASLCAEKKNIVENSLATG